MRQAFLGKAEGWRELQPLVHEQCPSPCSGRSHPAWLLYLCLSACFLHEPVQAAAASPGALLPQSLGESCTCFPRLQGAHLHPSSEPPWGHWASADGPCLSIIVHAGDWEPKSKGFLLGLADRWGSYGQGLGFSLLQFYYLKMGIGAGFALTCCQLLR